MSSHDRSVLSAWTEEGGPSLTEGPWGQFWEGVDEMRGIFRAEARDYVERLSRVVTLRDRLRVLDFGCGFGHVAEQLAPRVGEMALWDGSRHVRRRARPRVAHLANVRLLDLSDRADLASQGPFDLILVHSVIQYMSRTELARWLADWRLMLALEGQILVSDVLPPGQSTVGEMLGAIRFAAGKGILLEALVDGAKGLTRYFSTRAEAPLLSLSREELAGLARSASLDISFLAENLGHRRSRTAISLRRTDRPGG